MNYYFLIEDSKSLYNVLPIWLTYMGFKATEVGNLQEVNKDNYILQSGFGYTQLVTKALFDTIDTILSYGKIDQLILILDAEETNAIERRTEVFSKIYNRYSDKHLPFEIFLLVTNRCFETWLLGGAAFLFPTMVDPSSFFYESYQHYNIKTQDPELMPKPLSFRKSTAKYHFQYCHDLFLYNNIHYRKNKPDSAIDYEFFNKICDRVYNTNHVRSFKEFVDFFKEENTTGLSYNEYLHNNGIKQDNMMEISSDTERI